MIYIFDDRSQRRESNKERLNRFSNFIIFDTIKTESEKSLEDTKIAYIDNPECIMFHKSYVFEDSSLSYETVREIFNSYDVPVVIFSGGTEGGNLGKEETVINADLMYENLPIFIEDYIRNGKINLASLVWGKRHTLNSLLMLQNKLSEEFFIKNNLDEEVGNLKGHEDIESVKRKIERLCRSIHRDVGVAILKSIDNIPNLTFRQLNDIVNNVISQYK